MQSRVHISLEVSNLEKALSFYSSLFQTEPSKREADYANFRLDNPQLHLALVLRPDRKPEPKDTNRHYGIELFENEKLSAWLKVAQQHDLSPRVEENITCCYAVGDKFWARDPDGHEWEFWVKKEDAATMHEPAPSKKSSACCAPGTCC